MNKIKIKDKAIPPLPPIELTNKISIGMSAYGNYDTTLLALRSLLHSACGDFELILVDDCSPDNGMISELFLQARSEHDNTKVFIFSENMEYSGSLNAILSHALGEYVIFLSNDIFVTPTYLDELLLIAECNPSAGIVRGVSNFVDNGLQTHNLTTEKVPNNLYDLFSISKQIQETHSGRCIRDTYLTGDAFLVKRALLDMIGTLDPIFYGYFADHDYGVRARIAGFDLLLAQGAFAFHRRAANFDYLPADQQKQKLAMRWARVYENWARFKLKYGIAVSEAYTSINSIQWDSICRQQFELQKHYVEPGNYNEYLVS